jgi:hypothetical protein
VLRLTGLGEPDRDISWPMADTESPTAEYYRDNAEEIRHVARRARNPEIAGELLELAVRFDRMAVYADKPKLSRLPSRNGGTIRPPRLPYPIGVSASSVPACEATKPICATGERRLREETRWGKPGFHNRTIGPGENPLDRPNPQAARASMRFLFSPCCAAIGHPDNRC